MGAVYLYIRLTFHQANKESLVFFSEAFQCSWPTPVGNMMLVIRCMPCFGGGELLGYTNRQSQAPCEYLIELNYTR